MLRAENVQGFDPTQRTKSNKGVLDVGEIIFPGKSAPIFLPSQILSGYTHTLPTHTTTTNEEKGLEFESK